MLEKRGQVVAQCKAVAHLASAIAAVHQEYVSIVESGATAEWFIDQVGQRTAVLMETLGDILNGMDAVDDAADAWLEPVYREAHRLWPAEPVAPQEPTP